MANRRMLSKKIIDSDAFMDMPLSSQALYMHLVLNADDDGFVGNPKKIQRSIACSNDDIRILESKKFILSFESGVIVIKHWLIHNLIRSDRYNETTYLREKSMITKKDNRSYTYVDSKNVIPNGNQMEPQYSIEEYSIVENKEDIVETIPMIDYKSYIDFFNSLENLPNVVKLTDKRKKSLKARLKDYDDNKIKELWTIANNTPFLCGNNDRGWKADFDWLVNENNLVKISENKYTSKSTSEQLPSEEELRRRYG